MAVRVPLYIYTLMSTWRGGEGRGGGVVTRCRGFFTLFSSQTKIKFDVDEEWRTWRFSRG